jgi:hypothetical protein
MQPAKGQGRGQNHNIARFQAIHRLFVTIKSNEPPLVRHINRGLTGLVRAQSVIAAIQTILKNVGHGDQFNRAAFDAHGLGRRACAPSAATDQRHLDGVVAGGVDIRDGHARQGGSSGHAAGGFDKFAARSRRSQFIHNHSALCNGRWKQTIIQINVSP